MKVGESNIQRAIWIEFIEFTHFANLHFRYNVLDDEDIQGEEDGVSGMDGDVKVKTQSNKQFHTYFY